MWHLLWDYIWLYATTGDYFHFSNEIFWGWIKAICNVNFWPQSLIWSVEREVRHLDVRQFVCPVMQFMTRWRLAGYDQFMNIVLDNTVEIVSPTEKNEIGMVVIRGPWTTPLAISIVGPECISPYCHLCLHTKADSDAVYLEIGGVEGWNKYKHRDGNVSTCLLERTDGSGNLHTFDPSAPFCQSHLS